MFFYFCFGFVNNNLQNLGKCTLISENITLSGDTTINNMMQYTFLSFAIGYANDANIYSTYNIHPFILKNKGTSKQFIFEALSISSSYSTTNRIYVKYVDDNTLNLTAGNSKIKVSIYGIK